MGQLWACVLEKVGKFVVVAGAGKCSHLIPSRKGRLGRLDCNFDIRWQCFIDACYLFFCVGTFDIELLAFRRWHELSVDEKARLEVIWRARALAV